MSNMDTASEISVDETAKRAQEERKVVRKLDWILMPILMVTLSLQYYDKAVLGSAAVFGILEDMVRACAFLAACRTSSNGTLMIGPDPNYQWETGYHPLLDRLGGGKSA